MSDTPAIHLCDLCANAVDAYLDACGPHGDSSLDGLLATEAANWRVWRADGHHWDDVRDALRSAWLVRPRA
jgi:hypothetical protein